MVACVISQLHAITDWHHCSCARFFFIIQAQFLYLRCVSSMTYMYAPHGCTLRLCFDTIHDCDMLTMCGPVSGPYILIG